MAVILEALLGALHGSGGRGDYEAWRMVSEWISGQNRMRQDALVRDNPA